MFAEVDFGIGKWTLQISRMHGIWDLISDGRLSRFFETVEVEPDFYLLVLFWVRMLPRGTVSLLIVSTHHRSDRIIIGRIDSSSGVKGRTPTRVECRSRLRIGSCRTKNIAKRRRGLWAIFYVSQEWCTRSGSFIYKIFDLLSIICRKYSSRTDIRRLIRYQVTNAYWAQRN